MKVPAILYKYCRAQIAMTILKSRALRFTSPAQFNDPFEFLPCHKGPSPESNDELSNDCLDLVFGLANACPDSVCCFSSERDNLLMWGHYADGHKGIVIGFDTANPFFRDRLYQVRYAVQRIPIRLTDNVRSGNGETTISWQPSDELYRAVLTTKSKHWQYEREWRLIRELSECQIELDSNGNEIHVMEFPQSSVRQVIRGVRYPDEDRAVFVKLLPRWGYEGGIDLLPAAPHKQDFRVNIS